MIISGRLILPSKRKKPSDSMKILVPLVLFTLFLIPMTISADLDVSVPEIINGKMNTINFNKTSLNGVFNTKLELNNIGSVFYKARLRATIFSDGRRLYDIWTDEKSLNPGDKKVFNIYSFINNTGSFDSDLKAYYGGKILDYGNKSFEITGTNNPKDMFEIKRFRASGEYIRFEVKSNEDAKDLVIFFSDFPQSWIVEENNIEKLNKDRKIPVKIKYIPTEKTEEGITLHIFTTDGDYYTSEKFTLKEDVGFKRIFNDAYDFILRLL